MERKSERAREIESGRARERDRFVTRMLKTCCLNLNQVGHQSALTTLENQRSSKNRNDVPKGPTS